MSVWQTIRSWIPASAGMTGVGRHAGLPLQAKEAMIQPGGVTPAGVARDPGPGFRPLTQQSNRDLTPFSQQRMIEIAYYLWETSLLGGGIVDTIRDFVVGEGIGFETKYPEVDAVLKKFWKDPVNLMDIKLPKKVLELGLYGEQLYPVFVSEFAGDTRLGYVDPANIKEVVADPENCEILIGVALQSKGNKKGKRYQTVLSAGAEDIISPQGQKIRETFTDGEAFYFAVNNVSNAVRGRSDLLRSADWIDAHENFLYDRVDARSMVDAYVWDLTFTGLTEAEIKDRMKDMPPPKRGSVFGHNENVKRDVVAPDLKASDASEDNKMFKNHILGGKGLPPHWFGEGGDVNRATAAEMDPRIMKVLTARQKIVVYMVSQILAYVLQQKINKKELAEELDILDENGQATGKTIKAVEAFSVTAPDISIKDIGVLAPALSQIASALTLAEQNGWVSKADAARIFALLVSTLGMKIEPPRMMDSQDGGDPNVTKDYGPNATKKIADALGKQRKAANE